MDTQSKMVLYKDASSIRVEGKDRLLTVETFVLPRTSYDVSIQSLRVTLVGASDSCDLSKSRLVGTLPTLTVTDRVYVRYFPCFERKGRMVL